MLQRFGDLMKKDLKLESLNILLLRDAAFKKGYAPQYTDYDFASTYRLFSISNLESARDRPDVLFAYKIHNNMIDCSKILKQFYFYSPPRQLRLNNSSSSSAIFHLLDTGLSHI